MNIYMLNYWSKLPECNLDFGVHFLVFIFIKIYFFDKTLFANKLTALKFVVILPRMEGHGPFSDLYHICHKCTCWSHPILTFLTFHEIDFATNAFNAINQNILGKLTIFADAIWLQTWLYTHIICRVCFRIDAVVKWCSAF